MLNALLILASLAAFGVIHSLTAALNFKNFLRQKLGKRFVEGWYRLFYNIFSVVTLLPTLVLTATLPGNEVLFAVPMPWAVLMIGIQLIGLIGAAVSLALTSPFRFLGVTQAIAFLSGDELPLASEGLTLTGPYKFVRHPLYFFSLLIIWFSPVLTINALAFNIGATLYFVFGSLAEEKRLLRIFGSDYEVYRNSTSWLIPLPQTRNVKRLM